MFYYPNNVIYKSKPEKFRSLPTLLNVYVMQVPPEYVLYVYAVLGFHHALC